VPVVATEVGAIPEIIDDGVTGLLVPAKNPEAMANATIKILKDVKLSSYLAKNALKKVNEIFSLEDMVSKTINVYEEALAK